MYQVGNKLKCSSNVSGNCDFTVNETYEIATQRQQDKKFVIFDNKNNAIYFDEEDLPFYFKPVNDEFIKYDTNKIKVSLLEPDFILGVAEVATFGANKYAKDNWKKCEDLDRYKDATLRHLLAYLKGEKTDEETGLSHLHHATCNLMFLDYFDRQEKK